MYTAFNEQGRPVRTFELPEGVPEHDELVRLNTYEGETVLNGNFLEGHYLGRDGLPAPIPKPPSPYHSWDWDTKTYTGPHLDAAREEVWARIKAERERRWAGGFAHAGHWFNSDEASRLHYLTNKDAARDQLDDGDARSEPLRNLATGEQVVWKAMGGTLVPLTVGLALDVAKAAKVHEAQVFAAAESHRAAIYTSDDPNSYDYLSGWPDIYRGGDET